MMTNVFFSYENPYDLCQVSLTSHIFTESWMNDPNEWLHELLKADARAKKIVETLDRCDVEYHVMLDCFGYHDNEARVIQIYAYLLLDEIGQVVHKLA